MTGGRAVPAEEDRRRRRHFSRRRRGSGASGECQSADRLPYAEQQAAAELSDPQHAACLSRIRYRPAVDPLADAERVPLTASSRPLVCWTAPFSPSQRSRPGVPGIRRCVASAVARSNGMEASSQPATSSLMAMCASIVTIERWTESVGRAKLPVGVY